MKLNLFLILIINLIYLIKFNEAVCTQRYCGVQGAQCSSNRGCAPGFYCLSGVCSKGKAELETCSDNKQCQLGLHCINHGQFRVCKTAQYLGVGEKCTNNLDCYGSLKCLKGSCRLNKGANCTRNEDCGPQSYCKGVSCANRLQPGSDCYFNEDQCTHGFVCGKVDEYTDYKKGKCIQMFSKKSGESCFAQYGECDMADGLFCPSTSGITSTCSDIYRRNIKCKSTKECDGLWEECECDGNKTNLTCHSKFNIDSTCSKLYLALQNCASAKECTLKADIDQISELNENSCVMKQCKEQALCFYSRCLKFEFGCKMPETLQCFGDTASEVFTNFTLPSRVGPYNDTFGDDAEATKKPKPGHPIDSAESNESNDEDESNGSKDDETNSETKDNSSSKNKSSDSSKEDGENEKSNSSFLFISFTLSTFLLSLNLL